MPNLYVALAHYPVVNKNGEIIASAVTNLDLHDISRVAKTYGVKAFYVVSPLTDQKALAERIVSHWIKGFGASYNPKRREALALIDIKDTLKEVLDHIKSKGQGLPKTVATCARNNNRSIGYDTFREMLASGKPYLLVFGTAWGLSNNYIEEADFVLEPVEGNTAYNHLSVRSAAAIVLDRLMGRKR
jgi:hypothetical protein